MLSNLLMADILGLSHAAITARIFSPRVDRFVECQIDHEHMTVALQGHVCHVIAYPISIEWPPRWLPQMPDVRLSRRTVRQRFGIAEHVALGLGVERWDFTKGVIERFLALELLLEQNPRLRGQVTLLQIAAPSRSKLPAYQALQQSDARGGRAHQRALRDRRLEAHRAGRQAPAVRSRCSSCTAPPISASSTACTMA